MHPKTEQIIVVDGKMGIIVAYDHLIGIYEVELEDDTITYLEEIDEH